MSSDNYSAAEKEEIEKATVENFEVTQVSAVSLGTLTPYYASLCLPSSPLPLSLPLPLPCPSLCPSPCPSLCPSPWHGSGINFD